MIIMLRLDPMRIIGKAGGDFNKVIYQCFERGKNAQSTTFSSDEIPSDGKYRIGLYFGTLAENATV